ncbi:esterase-like activity of phytase family protein [Streptomyces albus subsp. chlorinus]|uniref:hypothetical protein n=1 Tax=Streptomyces albus TaxID=1888 RepID=UPI001570FFE4|nr:hypothetical protein [Streptomyces albus]NSC22369.1 esterase-like activity of phytase family protein [Streptomyces albus subsp. chlorinus]
MSVRVRVSAVGLCGLCLAGAVSVAGAVATPAAAADEPRGFTIRDPRITESSGLAASRAHKGVYWTHNDSDDGPYVYAVDGRTGKTVARVTMRGIDPRDVEAVSVGPDGDVYVGDIGDNLDGSWSEVWIYRFPEPGRLRGEITVTPTRYTVRYADGPRNAESLMVHPKTGRVYIASKSDRGKGGVYAGPERLVAGGVNTFTRVAGIDFEATDGAFSPDGTRLILRGYFSGYAYRWQDGRPKKIGSVAVPLQRQGESVTFAPDGRTLMFGSEGSGSGVEPVRLDGEAAPESAAGRDASGPGHQGDGASGTSGRSDDNRALGVGAATFAVALGLWWGLRRLFRRRGD